MNLSYQIKELAILSERYEKLLFEKTTLENNKEKYLNKLNETMNDLTRVSAELIRVDGLRHRLYSEEIRTKKKEYLKEISQ